MPVTSTTATPAQRAWLEQYERETTFEDWSSDAHQRIQKNNPAV